MVKSLKCKHGQKGFTLIELLVAIAILGILIAVVVPNITTYLGTGKLGAANNEAAAVQTAALAYIADGTSPEIGAGDVVPTDIDLGIYMQGTIHGTYTLDAQGRITDANYDAFTWSSGKFTK